MANARKCDICHNYYDEPEVDAGTFEPWNNTSMVRILRLTRDGRKMYDVMHFDACEKCLQDVLDYIFAKSAETANN